jgi:hypothetical protein
MIIGATNVGNGALVDVRAHGSVYTESILGMCATNTVAVIGAPASGCAMLVGTMVNSPLVFGTCNVERMRISSSGNIGIGTAAPNASSLVDVSSTTQGFLPPRMTTAEKNAIATPDAGLMVYDTTLNKLCVRTAAAWETITSI